MLKSFSDSRGICVECNEGIYNPVCPSCLSREVEAWLDGTKLGIDVRKRINRVIFQDESSGLDGAGCAICKEQETSICPYCFTRHIYDALLTAGASKKVVEEFLTFFSFDFEHSGYSKDFEEDFGND